MMGPAAVLCALVASTEPRLPLLCVDTTSDLADVYKTHAADIVDALRVRMKRTQLRVTVCDPGQEPATWLVSVRPAGDDVLSLMIDGNLAWSHELDVHGLRAAEVSRVVALYVVEAVRPSVDATLVKLGLADPDSGVVAPVPAEQVEAHAGEVHDRPGPVAIDMQAGPVFGAHPFTAAAQAQVGAKLKLETTSIAAAVALRSMSGGERLDVSASGGELHLELTGRKRWDMVELGLLARGRGARIAVSGSNPNVRNGARTYWDYGLGIAGLVWPWRGESVSLGFIVQATLWARPHWLSVEGQELLRQARTDVFLGPVLELTL